MFAPQIEVHASPDDTSLGGEVDAGPLVVVVGGIDPTGAAGLLRDVATARARGARPWAIGTAWTEQGDGVHRAEPRDAAAVGAALAHAMRVARPAAAKIGMAVGPATADALLGALEAYAGAVVVDPVLATSRGGCLWAAAPRDLLPLLRRATLVTPNAPEAEALSGEPVSTPAEAERAAKALVERDGLTAVLVKGGHLDRGSGDAVVSDAQTVTDILVTRVGALRVHRPRSPGRTPRGTGCALATALAVELGRGRALAEAVQAATTWLAGQIAQARDTGGERLLP